MADRPILFSNPMVRALLNGRKTQTRRVIKPQPISNVIAGAIEIEQGIWVWRRSDDGSPEGQLNIRFAVGDRLWVREEWSGTHTFHKTKPSKREDFAWEGTSYFRDEIWYWADGSPEHGDWERGRPSIHMPRWASRLTLIVTDVRVERLQDISANDAIAEGIEQVSRGLDLGWRDYSEDSQQVDGPRSSFCTLWNSIHGPKAWGENPWVTALTFDVRHRNIDDLKKYEVPQHRESAE